MTWPQAAFDRLARLVGDRTGLDLRARRDSAEAGALRAMARAGLRDRGEWLDCLAGDVKAFAHLVDELTVGETYFFREPAQYELIRDHVLPELRGRRGADITVRAWSAGCASGEEAYSLAILFEQMGLGERSLVLATDLSQAALARASAGLFGAWSLRGEAADWARPYLAPVGNRFRLDERIRHRVVFQHMNLASDAWTVGGFDLILCRNVLIYFDPDTVAAVAGRLFAALADGGWLLTAACDPPLQGLAPFATETTSAGLHYRRLEKGATCVLHDEAESSLLEPASGSDPQPDSSPFLRPTAATATRIREIANQDCAAAERECSHAVAADPLDAELHYLHGLLLMNLGRDAEAVPALQRVLYLDRTLAIAHFALGSLLQRRGDLPGARRAFRNARDLATSRPPEDIAPLADGETFARLAAAAAARLAQLDTDPR
jgi:chemotaxis protein methyltransferase CheR